MGQRLNIEIKIDKKVRASAYYHWSAYTRAAMDLVKDIIDYSPAVLEKNIQHPVLRAIKLLEISGAALLPEAVSRMRIDHKGIKFREYRDRNYGLIEYKQEGIENNRTWENARVTLDFDNETVLFDVWDEYDKEDFKKRYGQRGLDIVHKFETNPVQCNFDEFLELELMCDRFYEYNGTYYVEIL